MEELGCHIFYFSFALLNAFTCPFMITLWPFKMFAEYHSGWVKNKEQNRSHHVCAVSLKRRKVFFFFFFKKSWYSTNQLFGTEDGSPLPLSIIWISHSERSTCLQKLRKKCRKEICYNDSRMWELEEMPVSLSPYISKVPRLAIWTVLIKYWTRMLDCYFLKNQEPYQGHTRNSSLIFFFFSL